MRYYLLIASLFAGQHALAQGADTGAAQRLLDQQSAGQDKAQLDRRFEAIGTLLEKSSAARQVESSADPRAAAKRAEARSLYEQAKQAYQAGDYPRAGRLLSQASGTMFEAVRAASPQAVSAESNRTAYMSKLEGVKALLSAQKRISAEKGDVRDAGETTAEIERLVQEAERSATAGAYDPALATLNRAYLIAKAAIGSMRGGATLVRSLNFASKEEEYKYEVDRNDTHQLLIKMLVEDKRGNESMIQNLVERARKMRQDGDAAAQRGDHAAAVKLLEESTAELVKAIRNAGIFIPG